MGPVSRIDSMEVSISGKSQAEWVREKLEKDGYVTRNEALRHYISRLGSIIHNLKQKGWRFKTEWIETRRPDGSIGKDYKYIVTQRGV